MPVFEFTDEQFIEVINKIAKKELAGGVSFSPASSMDDLIDSLTLDSLGTIMFYVWLTEVFEIPDEKVTEFTAGTNHTLSDLKNFILENGTQNMSYTEVVEFDRKC